jgi:hypothetical protein
MNASKPGTFAAISRQWHDGDRIDLQLPRKARLEAIDLRHPDTVALLFGPLVLFAITNGQEAALTRSELLSATQKGKQVWEVGTQRDPLKLLPYIAIDDEEYSTYLRVT